MKKKKKRKPTARPAKIAKAAPKSCCVTVKFADKDVANLDNTYRNILKLTVTASKKGTVVLTGSGVAQVTSAAGTPWGWINVSIGPVSAGSNNGNETAIELPGIPGGNVTVRHPFSLTTVFPVTPGTHQFHMVGIQDPNPNNWSVLFPKLTAQLVQA
jgi:hypothetical protein